jgi:hypothetical protein
MRRIIIQILLVLTLGVGCTTNREASVYVRIIRFETDRMLLSVIREEWDGALSPHGYVGHRKHEYDINLVGNTNLFQNPKIREDMLPSTYYQGSVELNLQNMQAHIRIGETNSKSLKIDGKFKINSIRDATAQDRFIYPDSYWFKN